MIKKILILMLALAFCLTSPVNAGNIIWVSDQYDDNGSGTTDDQEWVDILEAEGHVVNVTLGAAPGDGYWRTLDDDKIAALNAADLVIVSRNSNSGSYDDGDAVSQWNSITTPIILNSTHIVRNSRWKWLDTGGTRWTPAKGVEVLLSDTIGFVKKLPHQLVASFRATLEEAVNADLLMHVVDVSNSDALKQIESVNHVLIEIGCGEKPTLQVLNKVDVVRNISDLETLQTLYRDAVSISARTRFGLDSLCEAVTAKYKGTELLLRVTSSHSNGKVQSFLRARGRIIKEQYSDSFVLIEAQLGRNQLPGLKRLRPDMIEIVQD